MRLATLLAVVPLAAAMSFPATQVAQAATVPPECDPGMDLTGFNIIIGTDASETLVGTDGPDFIGFDVAVLCEVTQATEG